MQLASNGDKEECSESEPILNQHLHLQPSRESSFSCEIIPIPAAPNDDDDDDDLQNVRVDETCRLVNADQPQCRICLDIGGEDLIAPCHCKGTQKYVHRSCLDNWRSTKEGFAFSHCTECRAVFILRANVPPDRWWLRLKFQFLVARDHAFIFIIVQLVWSWLSHLCIVELVLITRADDITFALSFPFRFLLVHMNHPICIHHFFFPLVDMSHPICVHHSPV
ncbi:E3 ubiquitin-protein ligase MARCH3 [Spatholobus suberectus]|nr:E3 ubiquitin-protein ligase MARCH3 [Spatholobus suberectus]